MTEDNVSQCKVCGERWGRETSFVHCVMCHRTFSTHSSLALHKAADNQCLDPASVLDRKGMPAFGSPRLAKYGATIWRRASKPGGWPRSNQE